MGGEEAGVADEKSHRASGEMRRKMLLPSPSPLPQAFVSTPAHPFCEPYWEITQVHRKCRDGAPGNICRVNEKLRPRGEA